MQGLLLLTLAVTIPASVAHANEGAFVPWTEATFSAQVPAPYGKIQLTLKAEPNGRLLDVGVVREGDVGLRVPAVAWNNIFQAQLGQARTTFKTGFDGTPWLFVHIPYGDPISVRGQKEWSVLVIAFRGDRAVYRALNIPKPRGGYDWLPADLPRE